MADPVAIHVSEETKLLLRKGDYYVNHGSVFSPNQRIKLNFVPIILNTIFPWMFYVFLLTISIFRWRHDYEIMCDTVWWFIVGPLAAYYLYRLCKELHTVDARWTRASCCHVTWAVLVALLSSFILYHGYFKRYYDVVDLKTYPMVDVSRISGRDVMDSGFLYFDEGTSIDFTRSWHFKHVDNYCVAPLVKKDQTGKVITPSTGAVDFFVVGKNCCSISSSDYRCPGFDNAHAQAGIRILTGDALSFYRLAVKQGETQYGFISTYPIFIDWVEDPVYVLEDIKSQGMAIYFILIFASFVWQLLFVFCCTVRFSTLGRRAKNMDGT